MLQRKYFNVNNMNCYVLQVLLIDVQGQRLTAFFPILFFVYMHIWKKKEYKISIYDEFDGKIMRDKEGINEVAVRHERGNDRSKEEEEEGIYLNLMNFFLNFQKSIMRQYNGKIIEWILNKIKKKFFVLQKKKKNYHIFKRFHLKFVLFFFFCFSFYLITQIFFFK